MDHVREGRWDSYPISLAPVPVFSSLQCCLWSGLSNFRDPEPLVWVEGKGGVLRRSLMHT